MGIFISGLGSENDFTCSYTTFNALRRLACKIDGYDKDLEDLLNDAEFLENTSFPQLMHFSDHDGLLVPGRYLDNIIYENSSLLGNSNKLLEELEKINRYFQEHPNEAGGCNKLLYELYAFVKEEVEEGEGILRIS